MCWPKVAKFLSDLSDHDFAAIMAAFEASGAGHVSVRSGAACLRLTTPGPMDETRTVDAPSVGYLVLVPDVGTPFVAGGSLGCVKTLSKVFQIEAPFSGCITDLHAHNGDFVGFGTPLFDIQEGRA